MRYLRVTGCSFWTRHEWWSEHEARYVDVRISGMACAFIMQAFRAANVVNVIFAMKNRHQHWECLTVTINYCQRFFCFGFVPTFQQVDMPSPCLGLYTKERICCACDGWHAGSFIWFCSECWWGLGPPHAMYARHARLHRAYHALLDTPFSCRKVVTPLNQQHNTTFLVFIRAPSAVWVHEEAYNV